MKRFLAFAYDTYYPSGGQSDFVGDFDSLHAAAESRARCEFMDVIDTATGEWTDFRPMNGRWIREKAPATEIAP